MCIKNVIVISFMDAPLSDALQPDFPRISMHAFIINWLKRKEVIIHHSHVAKPIYYMANLRIK